MERESNPMEALCRSGCGFYGNPATDGLCSVCFKEALKKKQQPPASTPSPVSAAPFVPAPAPAPLPAPAPAATPLAAAAPTVVCLPHATAPHLDEAASTSAARRRTRASWARARARAAPPMPTPTAQTKTPAKTRRRKIDAPFAARRLASPGLSAAAEAFSVRCTGTATSTTAPSTTGSSARRKSAATTPSSSPRRFTRYELSPASSSSPPQAISATTATVRHRPCLRVRRHRLLGITSA